MHKLLAMAEGSGASELGVGPGLGPKRQPLVWCQTKLQLHQLGPGAGHRPCWC